LVVFRVQLKGMILVVAYQLCDCVRCVM